MWAFALQPFNASSDKGRDRRGFNKDGNIYETRRRRFMSPVNNAIYNQAWQPNTCLGLVKFACPMKTFNYFNNFVAFLHDWFTRLWGTTKIWTLQHCTASVDMTRPTYRSHIRRKTYYLHCFEQISFLGNGIKRSSSQKMNASFTRKELKEFKDDLNFTGNDTECF